MQHVVVRGAGMSVSSLTPPPQGHACVKLDDHRFNAILENPLFGDDDVPGNTVSPTELQMESSDLGRAPSMPVSFAPLMSSVQCQHAVHHANSAVMHQADTSAAQGALGKCSVSVQTSPMDLPALTDTASDTSPESCTGAATKPSKMFA